MKHFIELGKINSWAYFIESGIGIQKNPSIELLSEACYWVLKKRPGNVPEICRYIIYGMRYTK